MIYLRSLRLERLSLSQLSSEKGISLVRCTVLVVWGSLHLDKWRGRSFQSNVTLSSVTLNQKVVLSNYRVELLLVPVRGSLYRKQTLVRLVESERSS